METTTFACVEVPKADNPQLAAVANFVFNPTAGCLIQTTDPVLNCLGNQKTSATN